MLRRFLLSLIVCQANSDEDFPEFLSANVGKGFIVSEMWRIPRDSSI
jgi:hypothetical protein